MKGTPLVFSILFPIRLPFFPQNPSRPTPPPTSRPNFRVNRYSPSLAHNMTFCPSFVGPSPLPNWLDVHWPKPAQGGEYKTPEKRYLRESVTNFYFSVSFPEIPPPPSLRSSRRDSPPSLVFFFLETRFLRFPAFFSSSKECPPDESESTDLPQFGSVRS